MRRAAQLVYVLLVIVIIVCSSTSCRRDYPEKVANVSIGSPPLESSALIYIAEDQRFFAENGLNVTIREYGTGAASLNGLLKREVDIAIPAEYALVSRAFQEDDIRAITSIDKVDYFYLIGRKDRGINNISDIKGKRVGVVTNTIAEFYLGRFLELHGMNAKEVTPVNIDIAQSENIIINGDIDAIISRPPFVEAIEERLGDKAIAWPAQSSQALYAVLISRNDWITDRPDLASRLLKSLARSEEYVIKHPAEAKAIVQKRLNFDDSYMTAVWSQNQFFLTLDQSLIIAMEDEARWMIQNNLTTEKQVPDFLNYIYLDGLKAVKPGAVNIIR